MSQPYEVHVYSFDTLRRLLAKKAKTDSQTIETKRHLTYFKGYFDAIGAKTIVVENAYTDRDYLEDFAGYYVRCFNEYPRRCTRLHFFTKRFNKAGFSRLLAAENSPLTFDLLQQTYLGFIVVKPLPLTVVGRTCLRTYDHEGRRYFPITRTYEANLFGLCLTVESLAFQEQDTVAAACATSALWSAFNGTGKQFQHYIPSPVEITRAATEHTPLNTRTFPNNSGLTLTQMAAAIRSVGLEPYLVNATNEFVLKSTLYAYLRGQIPVLLGIDLYDPAELTDPNTNRPVHSDFHAITVTGYSLGTMTPIAYQQSPFMLRAFRIDKIYAHDDQIGPFARMEFLHGAHLNTSWVNDAQTGPLHASSRVMLIPLYHKIRIPLETIFDIISPFSSLIEALRHIATLPGPLEWDIYLTNVNSLKSELQGTTTLTGDYRRCVLTHSMPRFLWRATALLNDAPALDLLFDATDIEQGPSFVGVVQYDMSLAQVLTVVAQSLVQAQQAHTRPDRHILLWLASPTF
jgi:hypothetical protein